MALAIASDNSAADFFVGAEVLASILAHSAFLRSSLLNDGSNGATVVVFVVSPVRLSSVTVVVRPVLSSVVVLITVISGSVLVLSVLSVVTLSFVEPVALAVVVELGELVVVELGLLLDPATFVPPTLTERKEQLVMVKSTASRAHDRITRRENGKKEPLRARIYVSWKQNLDDQ